MALLPLIAAHCTYLLGRVNRHSDSTIVSCSNILRVIFGDFAPSLVDVVGHYMGLDLWYLVEDINIIV